MVAQENSPDQTSEPSLEYRAIYQELAAGLQYNNYLSLSPASYVKFDPARRLVEIEGSFSVDELRAVADYFSAQYIAEEPLD